MNSSDIDSILASMETLGIVDLDQVIERALELKDKQQKKQQKVIASIKKQIQDAGLDSSAFSELFQQGDLIPIATNKPARKAREVVRFSIVTPGGDEIKFANAGALNEAQQYILDEFKLSRKELFEQYADRSLELKEGYTIKQ